MTPRVRFEVTFKIGEDVFVIPSDSKRIFTRMFVSERVRFRQRISKSRESLISRLWRLQREETLHSKRVEWRGCGRLPCWEPSKD